MGTNEYEICCYLQHGKNKEMGYLDLNVVFVCFSDRTISSCTKYEVV